MTTLQYKMNEHEASALYTASYHPDKLHGN